MNPNMDSSNSNSNWLAFSLSNHFPSSGADGVRDSTADHRRLSLLGGPKLDDFLGGGADAAIYDDDAELKTIAATFLTGFAADHGVTPLPPPPEAPVKKAAETFGQRTSIFRGVTRHRWTGRFEAHLWDNSCRREGQSRKGRQVYLGGYDKEEKAARAYDLAALKYWGPTTTTNFPVSDYEKEMEEMKHMTRQEFVASLRRKSSGFSRGASIYRGVTRHHQHGRWQARIGRVAGNKDLYLGTFSTQEEAAEAYDIAAIKFRGLNAVTNFDMSRYDVRSIASNNLPIGGATTKSKTTSESDRNNNIVEALPPSTTETDSNIKDLSPAASLPFPATTSAAGAITYGLPVKADQSSSLWTALGYNQTAPKNPIFQGTTPYSVEYHSIFNGCGYYQQQPANGTTPSSGSTGNTVACTNGTTHEAAGGGGGGGGSSWMMQAGNQAAKTTTYQTPIFGME